jgi:SNF family Na+-dependent transporter
MCLKAGTDHGSGTGKISAWWRLILLCAILAVNRPGLEQGIGNASRLVMPEK